jgi:hypothetical protein
VEAEADEAGLLEGAEEGSAVPVAAAALVLPEERADHSGAVVVVLRVGIHLTKDSVTRVCQWDRFHRHRRLLCDKELLGPDHCDGSEMPSISHRLVA